MYAKPDCLKIPTDLIRLFLHEAERVYCDKLVDKEDIDTFYKLEREMVKKSFEVIIISLDYSKEVYSYLNSIVS